MSDSDWRRLVSRLPTLAEMNAVPRATPKGTTSPKLERAKARIAADRQDADKLRQWATAVKVRDKFLDRFDGKPVLRGATPHPRRAEAHHIEPRANQAVRYDPRNGMTLSMENHDRVERGDLVVRGTRTFTVDGKHYIDGRFAKVVKPPTERNIRR
jgi:hypothetical protein